MIIDKIILFSIVTHVVVYCRIHTVADHDSTLHQFEGLWFEIGQSIACGEFEDSCLIHEVTRYDDVKYQIFYHYALIANIQNCDYGLPIYLRPAFSTLLKWDLYSQSDYYYLRFLYTMKSYNNGKELILTGMRTDECESSRYKLISRERQVSAETKAEFEKLAGNATAKYISWDHCPKVLGETDDSVQYTVSQIGGTWYDIAKIYYGNLDNSTCAINNVKLELENEILELHTKKILNGRPVTSMIIGSIVGLRVIMMGAKDDYTRSGTKSAPFISCNNGQELIWCFSLSCRLLSRHTEVDETTLQEFRKLVRFFPYSRLTIYSQTNCTY